MKVKFAHSKITSIEEELKVLKAQLSAKSDEKGKLKRFSDLEGLWKGKTNFSFEDIKEAEVKLKGD